MPQSGAACPERGSDRCGLGLVAGEADELIEVRVAAAAEQVQRAVPEAGR